MEKLFNVIAEAVARKVQDSIPDSQLWGSEFNNARVLLREALKACERWIEIMQELPQNY